MIVLDEQLLGQGLEAAIAAWYPGKVCSIKSLRPNSVIKDDAIPTLLSQESEPTFVTINVGDFWDQVPLSDRYCVVCFSLTSEQVVDLPLLLQRLLRFYSVYSGIQISTQRRNAWGASFASRRRGL